MLTPEQIDAIRDAATKLTDPISSYLISEIARRISEAGQLTSTAAYEVWKLQNLGVSQREIKKRIRKLLKVSHQELRRLLTQSAEVGYNYDIMNFPFAQAVPFAENIVLQQTIAAAVKLAQDDLTNMVQTIGFVAPDGKTYPLTAAYKKACDFAFEQVATGASDYNTAIRQATKNLAHKGVQWIDYQSGAHTSLEAAVRRNIMGGLGLMQEQISRQEHDSLGADGWEISAHAASAPDHEPIQGRQYSDAEYMALNNSLARRIGTLNCGHVAFPVILGVSVPQYTPEELAKFKRDNATGIEYLGKHYTMYEATQMQRKLERSMRAQKRKILVDESTGDTEKLQIDQIKLQVLSGEYKRFSAAAGLRTQSERAEIANFGKGQAARAKSGYARVATAANSMYDIGSGEKNIKAYMRDLPLRRKIQSDQVITTIEPGQFRKHVAGTNEYKQYVEKLKKQGKNGPSRLTVSADEAQALVDQYKGTGILERTNDGVWQSKEVVTMHPDVIGVVVDNRNGAEAETTVFKIHYGKRGTHIVPDYPSKKGAKGRR